MDRYDVVFECANDGLEQPYVLRWLVVRSFWQDYSKRILDLLLSETAGDVNEYLRQLLFEVVASRIRELVGRHRARRTNSWPRSPSLRQLPGAGTCAD